TGDSGSRAQCGVILKGQLSDSVVPPANGESPHGTVAGFGEAVAAGGAPSGAKPVVGIAGLPGSYWLASTDGGVFTGGGAPCVGSMGGKPLNKPIVGIASTPTGGGYLMAGTDGGVFNLGDSTFQGSTGGMTLNKPIVGVAARTARASALVKDATGTIVGSVTFAGTDQGVIGSVRATGLTPGF